MQIYKVLTECDLISGSCHTSIFRVEIQGSLVGGYQTSQRCAAFNFLGKQRVYNSGLVELIYETKL
jgi:hypothetical protein